MSVPNPDFMAELQRLGQEMDEMTAPTTAETPTKERLARNAARRYYDDFDWSLLEYSDREAYADAYWRKFVDGVEEDLREMLEPSEGMLGAVPVMTDGSSVDAVSGWQGVLKSSWKAMIRHIINEGLPTAADVRGILNEPRD